MTVGQRAKRSFGMTFSIGWVGAGISHVARNTTPPAITRAMMAITNFSNLHDFPNSLHARYHETAQNDMARFLC